MKMKPHFIYPVIASLFLVSCLKEADKGKNALVEQSPEPPGVHCATGGIRINSGIDENRNHGLDSAEIQQTEYVCNGNYDKETIIYFSLDVTRTTNFANGAIVVGIDNFDITNYLADSASFSAYLYTMNTNVKAFAELYDYTNSKVISNTLLTSDSPTPAYKATTVNFKNEFPKSPIRLGIRIRTEQEGTSIAMSRPMLKFYKR